LRTCAVGTRSRSIWSRLERGTRAMALATAEAVAEVAMARSQPVVAEAAHGAIELGLDVLAHLVQLERGGRVILQKNLAQPDGPNGLENESPRRPASAAMISGAAAADIDK